MSPDKLTRIIYFSGRFDAQVGRVGHGNSTPLNVMVSMVASIAVDGVFVLRSVLIKDNKLCICYPSANHAALGRKSKSKVG